MSASRPGVWKKWGTRIFMWRLHCPTCQASVATRVPGDSFCILPKDFDFDEESGEWRKRQGVRPWRDRYPRGRPRQLAHWRNYPKGPEAQDDLWDGHSVRLGETAKVRCHKCGELVEVRLPEVGSRAADWRVV